MIPINKALINSILDFFVLFALVLLAASTILFNLGEYLYIDVSPLLKDLPLSK
jgi:hypothetical protein